MTALAVICATAALLSLACLAVNHRSFRPLPPGVSPPGGWPFVSVVVPARNEERNIERAVASHLASDYPDFEVLVVDDGSTDGTPAILARLGALSPRLRVVSAGEPPAGWLGKPNALARGVEAARGERLLLVDADVEYSPAALRSAVGTAVSEDLGLLCVLPRIATRGFWEGVLMPNLVALLYLGPGFLFNEPRFRKLALGGGSGNLVSKAVLARSGGFESLRNLVIDDVGLARQIKLAGFRVKAFTACDEVRVRMYEGFGEIADGFTKNIAFLFRSSARVLLLVVFFTALAWAPYVVLLSGAERLARILAAGAIAATLAARLVAAAVTRTPLWSSFFHPLMVTVWAWIALRSVWWRVVLDQIVWRGRSTRAREAL